jgi:AcrR family transcriptional regulator
MGENDQADDRTRLLASARTILARGDNKFSIAMLCAEAGVTRDVFRAHFGGKAALLAALMTPEPAEPVVAAPDAWLERRLRVFERALNALEAPVIGVDAGEIIAQGGIAAALGFLSPLAAIFAFIDPGLAEDANCRPLLAEAQAKGAPVKTSAIRNAPAPRN